MTTWEQISPQDRDTLRRLADEWAQIAALPIQRERAEMWRQLNRLDPVKPLIWINEIPWHEMNVDDELTLHCVDPWCQMHERELRRQLYQWRHMPGDMTLEPILWSPLVIHDSGFGIREDVEIARTDEASNVVSRHFHQQINDESDLDKIQTPRVVHDEPASRRNLGMLRELVGDLIPVAPRGAPGFWFAPWDELIRWWRVEEAMMDLVLRPELVHQAMDRLVNAYLARLDQYEAQGLLSLNNSNVRVGSGGYGYSDELPRPAYDPDHIQPADLWGCGTAQIFSDVSPQMHVEFALRYERRWMDRFALTYYGCCEPLHLKIDMLRALPNLRKISMSTWVNPEQAAERLGADYVYSHKPNPAIFAEDTFSPQRAREELEQVLDRTRGCRVEVIMKDISTVRYQPQRLWEWAAIARDVTAAYA